MGIEFATLHTKTEDGICHRYGYGVDRDWVYQTLILIVEQIETERIDNIAAQGEVEAMLEKTKGAIWPRQYGHIKSVCHITEDEAILYPYLFNVFREELLQVETNGTNAFNEIQNSKSIQEAMGVLGWYGFNPKYEYRTIEEILKIQKLQYLHSERLLKTIDQVEARWKARQQQAKAEPQPEPTTSTSTLTTERDNAINEINTNHDLKQAFEMAKKGGLLDDNYQPTDKIKTFALQALLADCIKIEANTNTSWQLFNKLWGIEDKNKIAQQLYNTREKVGKVREQEIIFEVFKPQPHTNK